MRWILIPVGMISSAVLAQAELNPVVPLEPLASPYLLKLTGALLLVVMVIFGLAWLVKKFNLNHQSQNGLISIVAGLSIGTRDRIVLLQVGEEQILVGLTPGRIEKIHTLSNPLDTADGQSPSASFAGKLSQLMGDRRQL